MYKYFNRNHIRSSLMKHKTQCYCTYFTLFRNISLSHVEPNKKEKSTTSQQLRYAIIKLKKIHYILPLMKFIQM